MRITTMLPKLYPLSRRKAKDAIKEGLVTLNGIIISKDIDVSENDNIQYLGIINKPSVNLDDYLIKKYNNVCFIYKPPFVHSDRHNPSDHLTVSDIIDELDGYESISRLDYETDGVIAAVKKGYEISKLEKRYLAVVSGDFPNTFQASWSIDACNKIKVKVIDDNLGNLTYFKKISFNGKYSLIEAVLKKAARHQVRAFCANAGYPILGDKLYGGEPFKRLCLHSGCVTVNGYKGDCPKFTAEFIGMID